MPFSESDKSLIPQEDDGFTIDLAERYDELLEFLLEFTHRQAQWDQRQSELVTFQRRSIDQLKHSSRKVLENQSVLDEERRLIEAQKRQLDRLEMQLKAKGAELDSILDEDTSTPQDFSSELATSLAQLELNQEEFQTLAQQQQKLVQKTRLQRKKLAQQLRAQRAEIQAGIHSQIAPEPAPAPELDLSWVENLRSELLSNHGTLESQLRTMQTELTQLSKAQANQLKTWLAESEAARSASLVQVNDPDSDSEEQEQLADELQQKSHELEIRDLELQRKAESLRKLERHTKLQRKKISQQIRAQRAELENERLTLKAESADDSLEVALQIKTELLDQWSKLKRSLSKTKPAASSESEATTTSSAELSESFGELRDELLESLTQWQQKQTKPSDTPPPAAGIDTEQLVAEINAELVRIVDTIETNSPQPAPATSDPGINEAVLTRAMDALSNDFQEHLEKLSAKLDSFERLSLAASSAANDQEFAKLQQELVTLTDERNQLKQRNKELESKATTTSKKNKPESSPSAPADNSGFNEEIDRLTDELEAANNEIKTLKQKINRPAATASSDANLSWEESKRKMLEELESFDGEDEEETEERLNIEEVIKQTDRIIEQKEKEIQELEHLLAHQSESIGGVAVGATAIAEMLDQDELIVQERENLARLQEEWKDKLGKAEVELSIERAKIARERAELNTRIAELEEAALSNDQGERSIEGEVPKGGEKGSSGRGKWLNRLGLKEDE